MTPVTGNGRNVSPFQAKPKVSDLASSLRLGIVLVPYQTPTCTQL